MTRWLIILVLLIVMPKTGLSDEQPYIVPIDKDGVQRVEIMAGDYFFRPGHIVVKVNVPVELRALKETIITPHDLVIDAAAAGITIKESLGRQSRTFSFTPTKTGKYPIYCSKKLLFLKSHRKRGMEGILEVVE